MNIDTQNLQYCELKQIFLPNMHYPSIGNRDSVAREAQDNIALVSWRPASQRPIARNLQAQMSTTSDLEIIMHLPLNLLAISPKMQKTLKKIHNSIENIRHLYL